jgi:hypothetical protein
VTLSSHPKSLTVNGAAATSGTAVTVPLKSATKSVAIVVASPDGTTSTTYVLTIVRP